MSLPTHFRPFSSQRLLKLTILKTNIRSFWVLLHQARLKVIRVRKDSNKLVYEKEALKK